MKATLETADENFRKAMKTKDIETHFSVVLFIMLYKGVLALESVDTNLKCDQSDDSY